MSGPDVEGRQLAAGERASEAEQQRAIALSHHAIGLVRHHRQDALDRCRLLLALGDANLEPDAPHGVLHGFAIGQRGQPSGLVGPADRRRLRSTTPSGPSEQRWEEYAPRLANWMTIREDTGRRHGLGSMRLHL
jgi:hypothetical protein